MHSNIATAERKKSEAWVELGRERRSPDPTRPDPTRPKPRPFSTPSLLWFLPFHSVFYKMNALKRPAITVQQILEYSTKGNVTNLTRKIAIFCHKTLCNRIELRQGRCLSMRRLSNLSPFRNLSHGVFFLVTSFLGVERL